MDIITLSAYAAIALIGFGTVYYYYSRRPIQVVEQLRPRDRGFAQFQVQRPTDLSLFCKIKQDLWRFIKKGTAWTGKVGLHPATKYFGVEARAYTTVFGDPEPVTMTVPEYLIDLWTEVFYKTIPKAQRDLLENTKVGLTVEPVTDFKSLGWDTIDAQQVTNENRRILVEDVVEAKKPNTAQDIYKAVLPFLVGAFLMYFLLGQGYI